MKIIYGVSEGRKALSRHLLSDDQNMAPEIMDSIKRIFGENLTVEEAVRKIVSEVSRLGDQAVNEYSMGLDGSDAANIAINRDDMDQYLSEIPQETLDAMTRSAKRVREFNASSLPRPWVDLERGFGEIIVPIERLGIYIPGGSGSYPSTVLMTAIPARVAGVKEIFLCTPPRTDGRLNPLVAAAAMMADVTKIFTIGGAQAIAAMAYGTESVPKVDMICGPGNIFVTTAKRMVFGEVNIDGLEGPTETLLIADETANPSLCCADLLAQAEHDLLATPILITTSKDVAESVQLELPVQLSRLSRKNVASISVERQGVIVVVDSIEEALGLANYYAPEHLCLMIKEPWLSIGKVRNAGGIFLGNYTPEVIGDYIAGPSHVMPTGGSARFASYLGVEQFLKRVPVVSLDRDMIKEFSPTAAILARAEGFDAHARAAEIRLEINVD